MKKFSALFLCLVLLSALLVPVAAAGAAPEIIFNPQSTCWTEYAVASYTVKATGENLRAFWYLEWMGATYNLSDNTNGVEPWEGYAGESYGGIQEDANTFIFFFSGIEADLDGAYIWCVVEDGHYDAQSQKVRVSVGSAATPPTILDIPAKITVTQGDDAEIRCVARSNDGSQLSFLWYETQSGLLQDIQAVNRGEETGDYMFCDTDTVGTRNYICKVETDKGGLAYSSAVSVTVVEKPLVPASPTQEETAPPAPLPDETAESEKTKAPEETKTPEDEKEAVLTPASPQPQVEDKGENSGVPLWAVLLIAIGGAAAGVCVALLLLRKKT